MISTPAARLAFLALATLLPGCVNFHVVEAGKLYRSAQPDEDQLEEWIETYGLRTVLRLRGGGPGNEGFEATHRPTVKAGIAFEQVPMSAYRYPRKEQLLRLWEIFSNAKYPMLIHCRAGADRTGIAAAVYQLWATGDVAKARGQLVFFPYLHVSWSSTGVLDEVLDMYEPWQGKLSFPDWVRQEYRIPTDPPAPKREAGRDPSAGSGR